MSILSDAWRRARGDEEAVMRALGAPSRTASGRTHWLPWAISGLLLVVVVGLSVYLWRTHGLSVPGKRSTGTAAVARAHPVASSGQAAPARPSGAAKVRRRAAAASPAPSGVSAASAKAASKEDKGNAAGTVGQVGSMKPADAVPDAVRAQLPALPVTVHVWNPRPAARFIMVNGHVYHEGDALPEGVRLVSITPNGVVVNFKGYLITVNGH